jgi:hypothetical protein
LTNELIKAEYQQAVHLPETLVSALELLAREYNLTTLLLGAWALLLSRYSCEEDVLLEFNSLQLIMG